MKAAALVASHGWPPTWRPGASSRTATRLPLEMPRSSCIVLHGVDLEFSPAPGGRDQQLGDDVDSPMPVQGPHQGREGAAGGLGFWIAERFRLVTQVTHGDAHP